MPPSERRSEAVGERDLLERERGYRGLPKIFLFRWLFAVWLLGEAVNQNVVLTPPPSLGVAGSAAKVKRSASFADEDVVLSKV